MTSLATTDLSLPLLLISELIAACPTFRTIVGATDSTEALEHVHVPVADDTLVPKLDDDDQPVLDDAGDPVFVRTHPMPRATVGFNAYERHKLGTGWGGDSSGWLVAFEFMPDPAAASNAYQETVTFVNQCGQILKEMTERAGESKGAGEGPLTDEVTTHWNMVGYALVNGPAPCNPEEEQGELFYGALFLVSNQHGNKG